MEQAELCGVRVGRLGMGNMRLPRKIVGIDYPRAEEIIDYAIEHGINYFDTAWVYPGSEDFLGKALSRRHPRESFLLATKYFCLDNPNYRKAFEAQLRRCRTDHFDFYLIHCLTDVNYLIYLKNGCIEFFQKMKGQGKIGNLGFSTHASVGITERFADHHPWDFAQIQLNYYDWAFGRARREYDALTSRGIPIVVMEPVRGGKLAAFRGDSGTQALAAHPDWSAASWALRWVRRFDNAKVILSGMSSLEQIVDNVATFNDRALTAREAELLMDTCGAMRESLALPCTACRYCTESCPKGIDVPTALDAYNERALGNEERAKTLLAQMDPQPSACLSCGKCAEHCPQGIDIPSALNALAKQGR